MAESADERLAIDERYSEAHADINSIPADGGYVLVTGPTDTHLGMIYAIAVVVEDEDND